MYITKQGDTWDKIAYEQYGNELYATRLEDRLEEEGFEYNQNLYNLVANYYESKSYKITETNYDIQCQNNIFYRLQYPT